MDFPLPGGPIIKRLCPPATAISAARFTFSCPLTSAKSGISSPQSSLTSDSPLFSGSFSPARIPTTSFRFPAPTTSTPLTSEPSDLFSIGTIKRVIPFCFPSMTIGRTPGTFLTLPSSPNSPVIRYPPAVSGLICPRDARIDTAIGRSKEALFSSM